MSIEVQNPATQRAFGSEEAQLCHQIMVNLGLDFQRGGYIHFLHMLANILHLIGADQAKLRLSLCQCQPDAPPEPALIGLRPDRAHLNRTIAPGKWRQVRVKIGHDCLYRMICIDKLQRPSHYTEGNAACEGFDVFHMLAIID
jgi:hypothetical protein